MAPPPYRLADPPYRTGPKRRRHHPRPKAIRARLVERQQGYERRLRLRAHAMEWARFDPSLLTIPTRTLARLQTHMRHHGVPGSVILSACLEFAAPRMTPSFVDTFFRQYCAVVQDPTRPAQVERLRPYWAKKGTNRYRRAVTASQEVS